MTITVLTSTSIDQVEVDGQKTSSSPRDQPFDPP